MFGAADIEVDHVLQRAPVAVVPTGDGETVTINRDPASVRISLFSGHDDRLAYSMTDKFAVDLNEGVAQEHWANQPIQYHMTWRAQKARSRRFLARLDEPGLREIPGIGKDLAMRIREIAETGDTAFHRELVAEFPPTVLDLLSLQGVGPKTVATLYRELGIRTLDDLERAAADGRIRTLRGMGAKKEALILKALDERKRFAGRHLLPDAHDAAAALLSHLREAAPDAAIDPVGSLRRGCETCGDLDLLAAGGIVVRGMGNLLDGMVAVESGKASPFGELFNEISDRVADIAILIGAGYTAGGNPVLGYLAAWTAPPENEGTAWQVRTSLRYTDDVAGIWRLFAEAGAVRPTLTDRVPKDADAYLWLGGTNPARESISIEGKSSRRCVCPWATKGKSFCARYLARQSFKRRRLSTMPLPG